MMNPVMQQKRRAPAAHANAVPWRGWMRLALLPLAAGWLAGCATQSPRLSDAKISPAAPSPVHLIGATPALLRAALIPPVLRRKDGSAEVLVYNSQKCRLEIVLYPGAGGGKLVSLAQPMPRSVQLSTCMASLQRNGTS
jgi:hypothetical protein